jgi:integrase
LEFFIMPTQTLDAALVRTVTCPPDKSKVDLYDTAITGFMLEVRRSGGKTYWLRYRDVHGKQRQLKLGDAKSLTFEQARMAAQTQRAKVVLGDNPVVERQIQRQILTLGAFARERYLPYIKGYKRSWESDDSYLRNHLLPTFGGRHLDTITQMEVIAYHQAQRAAGYAPATANRLVILLRYMYNLARKWKLPGAEVNPAVGVTLFEENNQRERYLTAEEAQRLFQALQDSANPQLGYIVPLLLLTGCRKRELLDARWEDFDLEQRRWRIPLSKSGKARHVPLSDRVLRVLAQVPRWEGCPYVVPNPKTRKPYRSIFYSWDTARKQAGMPELRMHDLRHSLASFLVNAGRSLYEVKTILGHTQLKTTQRYAHLSQTTLLEAVEVAGEAAGLTVEALE